MKKKDCIKLAERVEAWQKRLVSLGVAHWKIQAVTVADSIPGARSGVAAVQTERHYDTCHFWFLESYVDECEERALDETIIHEWLHVALRDLDHALEVVETWMPEATHADWESAVNHEREGVIERLARTIYDMFVHEPT